MSSTALRSIEIATESSFCGLTSSNSTPNVTGLSFTAIDFLDAGQLLVEGDPLLDDPSGMIGGGYSMPARPVANGSAPIVRGSFSFDFYLRPWSATAKGIPELLKTRFDVGSGSSSSTISSGTTSSQAITTAASVTTGAGGVCSIVATSGATLFGYVCSYTSGTSFVLTPNVISRGATTGDAIDGCWSLRIPTAGLPAASSTCAIRIKGCDWSQTLYGCSLTSLSMSGSSDSRAVRCTATIDVAYVSSSVASGSPVASAPDQSLGVLHQLNSPLALSASFDLGAAGFTSGYAPNASTQTLPGQCVDEWSLNIEFTTAFSSCGSYSLGRSRSETTSITTTLEMHIGGTALYSAINSQWINQQACNLILGLTSSDGGKGAIVLPAAIVSEFTPAPDLGSEFVRTSATFAPGPNPQTTQPCLVLALEAPTA